VLARLRAELAGEGLHIVHPVDQPALDRRGVSLSLSALLPRAAAGLVIGDGGPTFFARFRALGTDQGPDPLDRYTTRVLPAALARALEGTGVRFSVHYPFSPAPLLPVQRLGEAAGLPPAGPLGIQIHPQFGPWWAYRGFAVLSAPLPAAPPPAPPCTGCPAPCIAACRGQAVTHAGLEVSRCTDHRLVDPACQLSCAARLACIVGPDQRYPDDQLGFHMSASLVQIRRYRARS
jgi:epoxyqueuosine reductase